MSAAVLCLFMGLAEIELNALFGDGAVLQTNSAYGARAFLYGNAVPGELLQVAGLSRRSAKGVPYPVAVGADGRWKVQLDPQAAGPTEYNLTITGSQSANTVTRVGYRYGDVILCGGQSNMVKSTSYVLNATAEVADAANWPQIQLFRVPEAASATPQPRFNSSSAAWVAATPTTVASFSAVCYLTARDLARVLGSSYPLGLVLAAVGHTSIDRWRPPKPGVATKGQSSDLFNGMISPIVGFSLKLILWYQGEADSHPGSADAYADHFKSLINGWRDLWGMGDIAFVYAQLAPNPIPLAHAHPDAPGLAVKGFPALRIAQAAALPVAGGAVDTTGMAVTMDLGDVGNLFNSSDPSDPPVGGIHPRRKSEVARRMALQALHVAYARQVPGPSQVGINPPYDGFADGPKLLAVAVAGGVMTLTLGNAAGLALAPTADCNLTAASNGIALASPNGKCCTDERTFELRFEGEAADAAWHATGVTHVDAAAGTVAVPLATADVGMAVASVRYAYTYYPSCVLVNSNGIPLGPFVRNLSTATPPATLQPATPTAAPPKGVALTPPMG